MILKFKRKFKNKRTKWIIVTLVVCVVIGFVVWARSENQGQIIAATAQTHAHVPAYKSFDGPYISFQYNANYRAQVQPVKNPDLLVVLFNADMNYTKQLAVEVSTLGVGGLAGTSAYIFRQSEPTVYTKTMLQINGDQAVEWSKIDGMEETVQIAHNNMVAVLSFSTVGTSDNLPAEVGAVLESFHWTGP